MPDEPEVEVLLLGSVQARRRGQPVHLVGSKQRTLLAALALEANRVVSDQRLIDLLWPEEPPDTAVSALRVHISKLRHAIEPAREGGERLLVRRASGYQLTMPEADIDLVLPLPLQGRGPGG